MAERGHIGVRRLSSFSTRQRLRIFKMGQKKNKKTKQNRLRIFFFKMNPTQRAGRSADKHNQKTHLHDFSFKSTATACKK
jgi:hypothetical protein